MLNITNRNVSTSTFMISSIAQATTASKQMTSNANGNVNGHNDNDITTISIIPIGYRE